MTFTGAAAVAGVVGWPIRHSKSPAIHNYWLGKYGLDGVYVPFAVPAARIAEALRSLPALGLRGVNVTVPHKEAAFRVMDETDPVATRMGAVNTVIVRENGTLYGRNTDAYGFLEALRNSQPSWDPASGTTVVMGAGGAARAIVAGLQQAGAPDICIVNRSGDRAAGLVAAFGIPVRAVSWERRDEALAGASLLVNATSLGMNGQPAHELNLSGLPQAAVVCDIVYSPLETSLLAAARARGNPVTDGLGMLLHQARPGFFAWFGRDPEVDEDLRSHVVKQIPGAKSW